MPETVPAGPQGDHEGVQLAAGLLPDLGAGGVVVRLGVGHVGVLVGLEPAGDLLGQPVGHRVVALGRFGLDGGRTDHHLGAVGSQQRDLLAAHLVGHDEDAAIALDGGGDRQADAGVAGGRLDDGAARAQAAVAFGGLDHADADAILDRAARVEVFELGDNRGGDVSGERLQAHQRSPSDQLDHGGVCPRHSGHTCEWKNFVHADHQSSPRRPAAASRGSRPRGGGGTARSGRSSPARR